MKGSVEAEAAFACTSCVPPGGTRVHTTVTVALLVVFLSGPLLAQEQESSAQTSTPGTRAAEIQAERLQKADSLVPEHLTPGEKHLTAFKDTAERLFSTGSVHLRVGGLPSGSGIGVGPVLQWSNSTDAVRATFSAVGSASQYYRTNAELMVPKFGARSLAIAIEASHSDAPSLNYYGPGPSSRKSERTDYRQEDTAGTLSIRWAPLRQRLIMKAEGGEVLINVGPGMRDDITSTELRYAPKETPGIDVQSNFVRAASSLELDGRDSIGDPHKGARVLLQYDHYYDLKSHGYSFARASADAQLYFPFFNRKRVIALRGRADFTRPDRNQVVPFFLQPVLGEAADFRGYRAFRYRDNNLLLFNAEYRWEVSSGFDVALFADSGRVFERARQINLSHLKNSAGFGFRFKSREAVVMRIDTGFSREGFQIWLKFGNVF
jgi:hypothetical protein